jgi:hypothetical protein
MKISKGFLLALIIISLIVILTDILLFLWKGDDSARRMIE